MTEPERKSLFRPEALANRHSPSLLGDVVIARPLSLRLLGLAAMSTAVLLIIFLCVGGYTRKLAVAGMVAPDMGLVRVLSPQQATVVKRFFVDGQVVNEGAPLYELSLDTAGVDGQGTQAQAGSQMREKLSALQESLANQTQILTQQSAALRQRRARLLDESEQASGQLILARERAAIAEATYARFEELAAQKFVAEIQLRERRQLLLDQQFATRDSQRALSSARRQIEEVDAEIAASTIRMKELASSFRGDAAGVGLELAQIEGRRALVLKAPLTGTATASLAGTGASLVAGNPMMSIVPMGSVLRAELYAPSLAIGFVRPGLNVRLRYRAFPSQTFGSQIGRIEEVSAVPIAPGDLPSGVADTREPMYRIIVSLPAQSLSAKGNRWPLAPGMQIDADLLLEHRRLILWLLAPMVALQS